MFAYFFLLETRNKLPSVYQHCPVIVVGSIVNNVDRPAKWVPNECRFNYIVQ